MIKIRLTPKTLRSHKTTLTRACSWVAPSSWSLRRAPLSSEGSVTPASLPRMLAPSASLCTCTQRGRIWMRPNISTRFLGGSGSVTKRAYCHALGDIYSIWCCILSPLSYYSQELLFRFFSFMVHWNTVLLVYHPCERTASRSDPVWTWVLTRFASCLSFFRGLVGTLDRREAGSYFPIIETCPWNSRHCTGDAPFSLCCAIPRVKGMASYLVTLEFLLTWLAF